MTTPNTAPSPILDWIARIGAAGAAEVAARFDLSVPQARARLQACVRAGTIAPIRLLHAQPALYVATPAGLRAIGLSDLRPCRVSPAAFAHHREVARAAVVLERALPGWAVVGERELRRWETDAGRRLASAEAGRGPDGLPSVHRPDLVLWPADRVGRPGPHTVAIEIELTVKAPRRLEAIVRGWARTRLVGAVVYYATPAAARAVRRAVDDQQAAEIVHVLDLDQVGQLPPPAPTGGSTTPAGSAPTGRSTTPAGSAPTGRSTSPVPSRA